MNITSTLVGLSVMGMAAPALMDASLAPVIAQKRAKNFAVAESISVTYAAANEWADPNTLAAVPDGCSLIYLNEHALSISCFEGEDRFRAEVTRSFRTAVPIAIDDGNNGHGNDADGIDESNPGDSKTYCPYFDPLGEMKQYKGCVPVNT